MQKTLPAYIHYFETLAPRTLEHLTELVAPEVHFTDPFNNVRGVEKMIAVFDRMFQEMEKPRFKVTDHAVGQNGRTAYLRWTLSYKRGMRIGRFEGMSEVQFDTDGKVVAHANYWDSGSQFLERLPMIGSIVRMIMKKASVG